MNENNDEYEYAVRRVGPKDYTYIIGNMWTDFEDRKDLADLLNKVPAEDIKYKIIRRRKAGPEEEVT